MRLTCTSRLSVAASLSLSLSLSLPPSPIPLSRRKAHFRPPMRLSLLHLRPLPERIAKLKDVPLFAQLNKRELSTVGRLLHEREFKGGEVIFDEGEEGQALYVVFSGEVVIVRKARPDAP